MSKFFIEDTCALKADPAIVGTIHRTWSEADTSSVIKIDCYIHKDLPLTVRKSWFRDAKVAPGYVLVFFFYELDGQCLLAEDSLQLIDRSFAAGDVVKKRLSDTHSGTVMETSLMCSLQPIFSATEFSRQQYPPTQSHTPSHGKRTRTGASAPDPKLVHGFPASKSPESNALAPLNIVVSPLLRAPASELKFWNNYREDDTLIYKGWIGRVRSVYDEVTVRLSNGSVVVVENAQELEEPFWIAGTSSYELAQRLDRAGYFLYHPYETAHRAAQRTQSRPAEPCYPGQHVQTKKGNLRCGRWKFGAYDPTVAPRGIVVEVRTVQIDVRWLCPITSTEAAPFSPLALLATEELESGEIIVYDRSKVPEKSIVNRLANASYGPDIGFGHMVRFKDPSGAAVNYGPTSEGTTSKSTSVFERIPRVITQGFDMNVLQVVATATKVTVCWQDCSVTEEASAQLFPYLNADEHDLWPGEIVSSIPDEKKLGDEAPIIRLHKVGVVQSVDARERIARIRWFEGSEVDIDEKEKASKFSDFRYGKLRDEISVIPLYDIAAHPALAIDRGNLVTISPKQIMPPVYVYGGADSGSSGLIDPNGGYDIPYPHSASRVAQPSPPLNAGLLTGSVQRARMFLGLAGDESGSRTRDNSLLQDVELVGEIVDLCLDGEVVVRLGAASEVREVKVPVEQVNYAFSMDSDSSDYSDQQNQDEDSFLSDAMSVTEPVRAVDVSMEYEGGEKLNDDDNDDEMWTTDDEDVENFNIPKPDDDDDRLDQHSGLTDVQPDDEVAQEPPNVTSNGRTSISVSSHSLTLPSFSVLEGEAPLDHHFFGSSRPLTSNLMRRIMKEHKIMQSSLPDGIFVRTWESRLDLLRVLIVGPFDTPYEFAPFVVDFHFGLAFPRSSPDAHFHSWTGGLGRINPNLYEDGKICLSLLGTWDADERNEAWSPQRSTVLQILVSLLGLVLVREPYYSTFSTMNYSSKAPA